MKCSKCGTENEKEAKFCGERGAEFTKNVEESQKISERDTENGALTQKKRRRDIKIFAALAGGCCFGGYWRDNVCFCHKTVDVLR